MEQEPPILSYFYEEGFSDALNTVIEVALEERNTIHSYSGLQILLQVAQKDEKSHPGFLDSGVNVLDWLQSLTSDKIIYNTNDGLDTANACEVTTVKEKDSNNSRNLTLEDVQRDQGEISDDATHSLTDKGLTSKNRKLPNDEILSTDRKQTDNYFPWLSSGCKKGKSIFDSVLFKRQLSKRFLPSFDKTGLFHYVSRSSGVGLQRLFQYTMALAASETFSQRNPEIPPQLAFFGVRALHAATLSRLKNDNVKDFSAVVVSPWYVCTNLNRAYKSHLVAHSKHSLETINPNFLVSKVGLPQPPGKITIEKLQKSYELLNHQISDTIQNSYIRRERHRRLGENNKPKTPVSLLQESLPPLSGRISSMNDLPTFHFSFSDNFLPLSSVSGKFSKAFSIGSLRTVSSGRELKDSCQSDRKDDSFATIGTGLVGLTRTSLLNVEMDYLLNQNNRLSQRLNHRKLQGSGVLTDKEL